MEFVFDWHLKQALQMMQENIPTDKLVSVASSMAALAPILWGHYERTTFTAIDPQYAPIARLRESPQVSNESLPAGKRCEDVNSSEAAVSL